MTITHVPLTGTHPRGLSSSLAAQVHGLDLRQEVDPRDADAIRELLAQYPVLVFPDQVIDEDQQIRFTNIFGRPHLSYLALAMNQKRRIARDDFNDISNLDENGELLDATNPRRLTSLANRMWHTDTTFRAIPSKVGILSAKEVPSAEGHTEFADMRAAYDALPQAMKEKLETLQAEHSTVYSRGKLGVKFTEEQKRQFPAVHHPLLRVSERTGRKSLYLSSHASHIVGMPVDEGRELLRQLTEHATAPAFCYVQQWKVGDLLVWDNRCTMHRAGEFDEFKERRVLARTGVDELVAPLESPAYS
ncbi:TauD/TfdA dioxygenase family protein [Ramlibacter sp.]|uniref:TauD/TfdA dioxygenase family protein n=1 Tax=Ramlibacter sp. TaxID=1917967 RepID=UPI003D0D1205